jgi:hypothetical protein
MNRILKILKFCFYADAVFCTLFVFALMAGFKDLFGRVDFLNPVEMALSDFDMTDLIYSAGIRELPDADTNIVLVNIGNLPRRLIARELEIISAQKPRTVGIDASFFSEKNPEDDSLLEAAMAKTRNLVLFSMLKHRDKNNAGPFDSVQFCNPKFAKHGKSAFVNLVVIPGEGENRFRVCRSFCPVDSVDGKKYLSFGLQLAWYEDSNKVKDFLARGNPHEIINFRGNSGCFYKLDHTDIIGRDEETGFYYYPDLPVNLRDKIVMMGFMGNSKFEDDVFYTIQDKFYTPMNSNVAGKAYPDMFGITLHANIASMVLRGKPVNSMGMVACIFLAIFFCYLNVLGFFYIHDYHPTWYDLFVKSIQIVEVGLILYLSIFIYSAYNYKIDVSLTAFAVGFSGDVLEIYVGLKEKILAFFGKNTKS